MRLIDADALNDAMYHEAFENDESYNEKNPMAKWDSGLWIRYKMFENAIDEAPTIDKPQWILCSEKLPSENDEYIITMGKDSFNKEGYVTWAMFDKLKKKFYFPGGRVNYYIAVTAWMPLPEPMKGADDEVQIDTDR